MARKIITCTACKARFDVARYPPGSRVRCGRCSQVLTVPIDEPTGTGTASVAPRVVQPVRKARDAGPARPAADMAPTPKRKIGGTISQRVVTSAGGSKSPDRDPLLGETVYEQYQIIRKLGEGGYGAVYEAHDFNLERRMAIKVMLRSRAASREYVTKFLREARTAAQLSHPNVVGVHGVGFDKKHGIHFLSMEYVEGRTIHDILQERGSLPADDAIEYIVQSCRGLAAAHDRNIIHRDIKPGNLMVTPSGVVKIADFGLAKVYDPDGAQSTVIGTPYFMPPEQFEGKAKDGRTDIYALGVTFYYMLTMQRPHTGNGPAQILLSVMTKEPTSICEHEPDLPEGLWAIVHRMIHRSLDERYSSCNDIIRDLEALRGGVESDEEPVYCPACGVPNPMDSEECGKCGESLLETCPVCNAEDLAGTRFCGDCGSNIPEERAVAALVDEARGLVKDGSLDDADTRLVQAHERSPENLSVAKARHELEVRREDWVRKRDAVRVLLGKGGAAEAHERIEELRTEFAALADLDVLESDVRSALAAQDPVAAADAEAQDKARRLEETGRIREALVAWRGVRVLSPDDDEAKQAERRLAARVERAESLFAEATDRLSAGDPETAVERLLEANTVLPGDDLIEGRLEEARRTAEELSSELAALEEALSGDGSSAAAITQLIALRGRFPESATVAAALREAESAGRAASAEAVRERLARVLEQGRAAAAAARPREAMSAWREACLLDPDDREAAEGMARAERQLAEFDALLQQSRTLLQSGDPERALSRAERALALVPGDPSAEAQVARARTSLETMRHEVERIRSATTGEPDDDVLQWAQELAGRFSGSSLAAEVLAEAEERCREVAEKEADDRLEKLLERAVKLEHEGNVRAAVKVFEDAVELAPDSDDARAGRQRAQVRLDTALQRSTEATDLLERGHPEAAQAAAREALDLLPDQADAAVLLARARASVSEIDRAIRSLREDLPQEEAHTQHERMVAMSERFPGSPRVLDLIMRAEKVIEAADRADTNRRVGDALRRARAALEEGRLADADAACAEVTALRAEDPEAARVAAEVAERRATAETFESDGRAALAAGRLADAIDAFGAALAADPERESAQAGRAEAQTAFEQAQGRIDEALEAARAAEGGPRERLALWSTVAALDATNAEAETAVRGLEESIGSAEARRDAGIAAQDNGRPDDALRDLEVARAVLGDEGDLAERIERARVDIQTLDSSVRSIEAELDEAEGELEGTVTRSEELLARFPTPVVERLVERARALAGERRRALAVARVKALIKERRYGEAVTLATSFQSEGIDTPELAAATKEARDAAEQIGELRTRLVDAKDAGHLEDARDICREILHSLPDDREAREFLHEVEETLREVAARRDLAETARRRGDVEEALGLYREVLELRPAAQRVQEIVDRLDKEAGERRGLVASATAALMAGDPAAARNSTRRLLERYPDDDDIRDLDSIAGGLTRALEALVRRATRRVESGDRVGALAALDLAERVAGDPTPTAALRTRAEALVTEALVTEALATEALAAAAPAAPPTPVADDDDDDDDDDDATVPLVD